MKAGDRVRVLPSTKVGVIEEGVTDIGETHDGNPTYTPRWLIRVDGQLLKLDYWQFEVLSAVEALASLTK